MPLWIRISCPLVINELFVYTGLDIPCILVRDQPQVNNFQNPPSGDIHNCKDKVIGRGAAHTNFTLHKQLILNMF